MRLSNAQKKVISNIFRDLSKLSAMTLVIGQFVPNGVFCLPVFLGGLFSSALMASTAVIFAVE